MRKWQITIGMMMVSFAAHANFNPNDLVKVSPQNNPSCVEYYTYKNAMYCSTKALSSQPVDSHIEEYETQNIVFDERPWQMAWGKKDEIISTVEYIPAGDDINQWHELVTSQFIPNPQLSPIDFADSVIEGIKTAGFSPIVSYFKKTSEQVILEFRIESPANQAQDELQIITKGTNGLYIVHYTIKQADMSKANREKWLQLLKKSSPKS